MIDYEIKIIRKGLAMAGKLIDVSEDLYNKGEMKNCLYNSYLAIMEVIRSLLGLSINDGKKYYINIKMFKERFIETGKFNQEYLDLAVKAFKITLISQGKVHQLDIGHLY